MTDPVNVYGQRTSGIGRPAPGLPGRGRPRPVAGMTGATGRAVMAASRTGGGCAAGDRGGRDGRPPGTPGQAMSDLGEIAPVLVSEGDLNTENAEISGLPG